MITRAIQFRFYVFHQWVYPVLIILCSFLASVKLEDSDIIIREGINMAEFIGSHVFFEILDPPELSYTYRLQPAKDFGVPFNSSFQAFGTALVPVDPPSGCGWPYNANDIAGNVALVERGQCSFLSKAVKAEELGARAVIVADHDSESDDYFIEMIDDKTTRKVGIPAGFLLGKNGFIIRQRLLRLKKKYAIINIPVNMTYMPMSKIRQPPWLAW